MKWSKHNCFRKYQAICGNPKNVIATGINAISQIKAIKKFQKTKKIERSILLVPNSEFQNEIEVAIKETKIKLKDKFIYSTDPTALTSQIEKLTRYGQRKQNLEDEITRLENSNETNKENSNKSSREDFKIQEKQRRYPIKQI